MFFGLNVDFGLNFLLQSNILSSFRKCYINLSFLPKTSNSCLSLALSILLGVGTNLSPFERSEISDFVSRLCDKLRTFLLTNFPSCLLSFNLALLSSISCATSELLLLSSDSIPLTKSHALLTSSLSLFSKSRYKCLFTTRFLISQSQGINVYSQLDF